MEPEKQKQNENSSLASDSDLVIPGLTEAATKKTEEQGKKTFTLEQEPEKDSFKQFLAKRKLKKPKEKVIKGELIKGPLFVFKQDKTQLFLGALLKNIAFVVLSLVIFVFTFYLDAFVIVTPADAAEITGITLIPNGESVTMIVNGEEKSVSTNQNLLGTEKIQTENSQNVIIALSENALVRLDQNTTIRFSNEDNQPIFTLDEGKMWVNTLFDNQKVRILTEHTLIEPDQSAIHIEVDDTKTSIYAHKHNALVSILNNFEIEKSINDFWLIEGNQVNISHKKVVENTETISRLLYTKLTKEFQYGRLSSRTLADDPWLSSQIAQDAHHKETIRTKHLDFLRDHGLKTVGTDSIRFQAKLFIDGLQDALTFSDTKKADLLIAYIFENIFDAEYLYLQGNRVDADLRMVLFQQDIDDPALVQNEVFQQKTYERLNEELANVLYVTPADSLYPSKSELIKQLSGSAFRNFVDEKTQFKLLTLRITDVYDAIKNNPTDILPVLTDYFDDYKTVLSQYRNNYDSISKQILKQNLLVDTLFLFYPELYKLEFFENKRLMENDYLASLRTDVEKQEQRQQYISNKINLLKRIQGFLFNDLISTDDARQVVFVLIQDIEELQKGTISIAAVNALFDKQLKDFGVFWQYLNTPEFSTTPLHGATHELRFEEFKDLQQEILTFEDVRQEILSTIEEEELTVQNIMMQAQEELEEADITDIEFGFYNDVRQTKIPIISAKIGTITFRATYNWDRKLLSNILVNDELISEEGIKLENARRFILEAISSERDILPPAVVTPPAKEKEPGSKVENAAKVFLIGKFENTNMVIKKKDIEIVDLDQGIYNISDVLYKDKKDAVFSFTYTTSDDKVTNLVIQTDVGPKEVDDVFSSAFLKSVVIKIFEEAAIE